MGKKMRPFADKVDSLKHRYERILSDICSFATNRQDEAWKYVYAPLIMMLLLSLVTLIFPLLLRPLFIVIQLLLSGAVVVMYVVFSESIEKERRKEFIRAIKASLLVLIIYTCTSPFLYLGKRVGSGAIASVGVVASALAVLLFFVFSISDAGKKFFYVIEHELKLSIEYGQKVVHPGDVILCNVKVEDNDEGQDKCEILPYKDRFLHMLILGATGTGKTSQILIPMIHQDIQNHEIGVIVLEPKGDLAQKIKMMS